MEKQRGEVNGIKYYAFTSYDEIIDFIEGKKNILVAINAGKLNEATDQTRAIINNNIGYCDGIGAVWPLRKQGFKEATTLAGSELWKKIIARWYPMGRKFYFVGGKQEIIDQTVAKLYVDFPNLNIAGYRNGYIKTDVEKQALIEDILRTQPDIVFVAMGSPKQELLMNEMYQVYPTMYQGLGGSYDVYVGAKKMPPQWIIKMHLWGVYRTLSDLTWARIKRLWKDMMFLIKVWLGIIK